MITLRCSGPHHPHPGFYTQGWDYHGEYLEVTLRKVEQQMVPIPGVGPKPRLSIQGDLHHSLLVDEANQPFAFETMSARVIWTILNNWNPVVEATGGYPASITVKEYRFHTHTWCWPIFKLATGHVWSPDRGH